MVASCLMVVMQVMSGGDRDDPEADDEGADGEDPAAHGTVVGSKGRGLASAENLAADADGHQESAEDEGGPGHGLNLCTLLIVDAGRGRRQVRRVRFWIRGRLWAAGTWRARA